MNVLYDPDRKSTRLNSSHLAISYAVFCLKKNSETARDPATLGRTDWLERSFQPHITMHCSVCPFFFFNDTATTEIYTLSLHDALPISPRPACTRSWLHSRWWAKTCESH